MGRIKIIIMKKHLLFAKLFGTVAVLCLSLLFVNCSEVAVGEPTGEAGTRTGDPYLQVTSSATEFYVGQAYVFGLDFVDPNGLTLTYLQPDIHITGGSYTTVTHGAYTYYIFNEGAVYTVTGSEFVGNVLMSASMEVNTTVFMKLKRYPSLEVAVGDLEVNPGVGTGTVTTKQVTVYNKLEFFADSTCLNKINVTKPVSVSGCHYQLNENGIIYHPYWFTFYLNGIDGDIVNGEYQLFNTSGLLDSNGLTHYSFIDVEIDEQ